MSRAPIIGGVVLIVIVIVTTIILMMGGEEPTIDPILAPSAPGPSAPGPSATEPSATEPSATEPSATEPSATEPSATSEPPIVLEVSEPQISDPPAPRLDETDVINPPSDETPGDVTTGMLKCVNTRRRDEMGWEGRGRWKTEAQARNACSDFEYMSLECPNQHGFEVFCANDISEAQTILNRECKGDVEGTELAGGTNAHCVGPYKWEDLYAGGANRGAVYKI
ncbi:hypothetical protein OMVG_00101 [Ostreococcus lucimarinus virus OlV3]|nr:hypothetical protein OMVG_00101 [Ostreococcus lucimarinus virus OlV3]